MPDGGKLSTITTANITLNKNSLMNFPDVCAGEYVLIVIADTGTGMSRKKSKRICLNHFSPPNPLGKGTGLGLATSASELLQTKRAGHITVHSELGNGTTFKISIFQKCRGAT